MRVFGVITSVLFLYFGLRWAQLSSHTWRWVWRGLVVAVFAFGLCVILTLHNPNPFALVTATITFCSAIFSHKRKQTNGPAPVLNMWEILHRPHKMESR